MRILEGLEPYPEDEPGHCCALSGGIRLVFSIEIQPEIGASRHLSASVDVQGHLPNPVLLEQKVMPALGFRDGFKNCHLSYHEIGENHRAADILEPINEPRAFA